ncbi:two-component system sensor histidine kinase NtrB [Oceanomicrobium pacificus]|uniref:histidine kinase n=1 Tax=Oceanomicrobium pacificus TaxID=2692916 RepID=A0A6B0TVG2_9RHOB|nr:ATP-binding protein [Oceanomicrobium pacificus]MXU65765.1 PAS domain-containing protein [Oceanomicrobium pacificus]
MTNVPFDAVWAAIPYPAIVLNRDDEILSANSTAEVFCGTSAKQMVGRKLSRFTGEDSALLDAVQQTRRGTVSVVQHEVEMSWTDRVVRLNSIHAAPLQDDDGTVLILMHPRGVAEKMDRSMNYRSAARSVTGMAAMLAHEIRNPLAGISGAAQLLAMNLDDADRELTDLINDETKRIGNLVERVEQFGDLRPALREPVNIHDVLDRSKRAAQAGFAAHVRFIETYDPSLPPVVGDSDQLMQVFQNLLKNAAEAVPKVGGTVQIRTSFRPGLKLSLSGQRSESLPLQITIVDNGPGIPEGLMADIFDPFVSTKTNGSGLGLSLVSKIVADHGGLIECDSMPGRTQFQLLLPIWQGPLPVTDDAPAQDAASSEEGAL